MEDKKVLIIHSWHGGPKEDWMPWLKDKLEKKEERMPITCPNCKKTNEYDAEICAYCNMALSQKRMVKDISEFEEKMKLLEQVLPLLRKIDANQQKEANNN